MYRENLLLVVFHIVLFQHAKTQTENEVQISMNSSNFQLFAQKNDRITIITKFRTLADLKMTASIL